MSLSNSTNFQLNAGSIVTRALNLLMVTRPDDTVNTDTMNFCLDIFNMMIKAWVLQGAHLWTQMEGVIVFQNGTSTYTFPDVNLAGGDVGVMNKSVLNTTQITSAASNGATSLTVTSTSGMSATDHILIQLDNGNRFDTTIASITSSTVVQLNAAITNTAAINNYIFTYPAAVTQADLFNPRQIYNVRFHSIEEDWERPLTEYSRTDYYNLAVKDTAGLPVLYYLDEQLTNKKLIFYPVPDDISNYCTFTYTKALDDIDHLTDDVEFPPEWGATLVWNLAVWIAPALGRQDAVGSDQVSSSIAFKANQLLTDALASDKDKVNIQAYLDEDYNR